MHRICIWQQHTYQGVTTLMICSQTFLLVAHNLGLALRTSHNPLNGILQLRHKDGLLVATSCQQSSLVNQVAQICTSKARCSPCQHLQIHILVHWLTLDMYLQNGQSTLYIRTIYHNLAVKTTWTQQSWIKNIRTVGSSNNDNTLIGCKAVHLNQHLVQSLLTLIMSAA